VGLQDYAVVVGINTYPDLGSLSGPTNDALDFREWLLDPAGGNVPGTNIQSFVSEPYAKVPPVLDARPQLQQVENAFLVLLDKVRSSGVAANRLYLYFAGHGFSKDVDDAALLMANAARGVSTTLHIQGGEYAKAFAKAALFDEVVLFMDCCREDFKLTQRRPPVIDDISGAHAAEILYGYAAKWSRASREGPWGKNNAVRGIFTLTLLAGLRGAAKREPGTNQVSATALSAYVVNTVKQSAGTLQPGEEKQEPDLTWRGAYDWKFNAPPGEPPSNVVPPPAPAAGTVVVETAAAPQHFTLTLPVQNGTTYQLTDSARAAIAPVAQSATEWTWHLPMGYYKVTRSDGVSKLIEAGGMEENLDDPF
jgi:hypothetical protein